MKDDCCLNGEVERRKVNGAREGHGTCEGQPRTSAALGSGHSTSERQDQLEIALDQDLIVPLTLQNKAIMPQPEHRTSQATKVATVGWRYGIGQ